MTFLSLTIIIIFFFFLAFPVDLAITDIIYATLNMSMMMMMITAPVMTTKKKILQKNTHEN